MVVGGAPNSHGLREDPSRLGGGGEIDNHEDSLPAPRYAGEQVTDTSGARYVAVRRWLLSRQLRWERVLFDLPPTPPEPPPDDR